MAENHDGTLTPAAESASDALRRVATGRSESKLREAQERLAQLLLTDPDAAQNKAHYIASLVVALRRSRDLRNRFGSPG